MHFNNEVAQLASEHKRVQWEREKEQARRDLYQWFIKPPVRIEWVPSNEEAERKIIKHHRDPKTGLAFPIPEESPILRGGALMEYLLPKDQLKPALFITPTCALQAIAAAIYAERIHGITYKKCNWCGELFQIRRHQNKLYCDATRCKGNAHKQRQRANRRKMKAPAKGISQTRKKKKGSA